MATANQCTGVFWGGGDQSRITNSFYLDPPEQRKASPVLTALLGRYQAGAVMSGSSAGTAVETAFVMITGGLSWDALRYGAHTADSNEDHLTYDAAGGLPFFPFGILDTHFSNRGREGRLIRLTWDTRTLARGTTHAFGVDQNTALVVTGIGSADPVGEVIGEAGVLHVNVTGARAGSSSSGDFSLHNTFVSYLTQNDKYHFVTGKIDWAPWKVTCSLSLSLCGHFFSVPSVFVLLFSLPLSRSLSVLFSPLCGSLCLPLRTFLVVSFSLSLPLSLSSCALDSLLLVSLSFLLAFSLPVILSISLAHTHSFSICFLFVLTLMIRRPRLQRSLKGREHRENAHTCV